jgi:dipeptidyl aminopeptidase/acylaminoacyl peptidase
MMTSIRTIRRAGVGVLFVAIPLVAARSQDGYRNPPDAIAKILDSPAPPVAAVSADRRWLLITTSDVQETTLAELAEPTLFIAGRRFQTRPVHRIDMEGVRSASLKPVDGGPEITIPVPDGARLSYPQWSRDNKRLAYFVMRPERMTLHVFDVASKSSRAIAGQADGRLSGAPGWSRDGKHFLFTATTPEGEALWVADVDAGSARRLTPHAINYVAGGCSWTAGRAPAVCLMFPQGRGEEPKQPAAPSGPVVQESFGRAIPSRTNTYLLKDQHDVALFDHYLTSQLVTVALDGRITPLGAPAVHAMPSVSPDGQYLLVRMTHKPYSFQVGQQGFPTKTEVWTPDGRVVRTVYDRPLMESQPSARDATSPGIRGIAWRPDEPATLVLTEALDDGDPRKSVPKRDRVSLLKAPFTGQPQPFVDTEMRFAGIEWLDAKTAILSDISRQRTRVRSWVIDPSVPNGGAPRPLWDFNFEDRVATPGDLIYQYDPVLDRSVPIRSPDGRFYYLGGPGASKDASIGDRPYLDRIDIATGKTERLWQSAAPYYETIVALLDAQARKAIVRRESPTERPDYYVLDVASKKVTRLTNLPDPAPFFSSVKAERITYKRPDGTQLSGTMYLPPNYNKARDGKLPFFLWAYPQEFMSQDAASQVSGSPYQFRRPSRADHLLLLAAGYGVLDNPTMPIVGMDGKEPNDNYVPQLVASAKAAIDKLEELGVGDRDRVGVGGHSYGAFMTGNLLAHSDLFRAGIARSGAYNRTLTPFGFQAEPRTYWQAPEVYDQMSPFHFADRIKEPILLIHGTHDNNQGTFPVQSERFFAALKGNGGNVRYVQLPLESHGYIAKESRRHVVWEMVNWLDTYVKQPKVTP